MKDSAPPGDWKMCGAQRKGWRLRKLQTHRTAGIVPAS